MMQSLSRLTPARIGRALAWRYRDLQPLLRATVTWRGESPRVYLHNVHPHPVFGTYLSHPTLRYAPYPLAQLCHWVDMVPNDRLLRKPHVFEVEHPLVLVENRRRPMADWFRVYECREAINAKIARPECRRVVTFSKGLVEHAKRFIDRELWGKLDYAYPAFPPQPGSERSEGSPFKILSIASRFSDKGIPEAIDAFRRLREGHGSDVSMTLVSQDVPAGYDLPDGLTLHTMPRMSDEFKRSLYQESDVLLLPCYSETAACFTEATAFGVPIVTTRIHHGDEFVQDGRNGYLIEPPFFIYSADFGTRWRTAEEFWRELADVRAHGGLQAVTDQAVEKLEAMISNRAETNRMRGRARQVHAERFAPDVRNEKLLAIYQQALDR